VVTGGEGEVEVATPTVETDTEAVMEVVEEVEAKAVAAEEATEKARAAALVLALLRDLTHPMNRWRSSCKRHVSGPALAILRLKQQRPSKLTKRKLISLEATHVAMDSASLSLSVLYS